MASKSRGNTAAHSKSKFTETIHLIARSFSLFTVFDDFLTLSMAACTQNLHTGKSWYEDEYLATFEKYKNLELRFEFPKAFGYLINEMEERVESSLGNDVLGEFFEDNISNGRNGQFFTPFPVCEFMASITHTEHSANPIPSKRALRILDPACGSGRMLLASRKKFDSEHEFYGIDIDRTCVKMAALNLFLNGMWNSEVMCADALRPDSFSISYKISFSPLGIFKIEDKEQSKLWHLHKNSFAREENKQDGESITLDSTPFSDRKKDDGIQLDLF